MEEVGRNKPCPCGSGKKFKHCHGKVTATASDPAATVPDDMQKAIEHFYEEADGIVTAFARKLEAQPPPEVVYHYTNDAGLRGILETGILWLTDIFNLNDPSELRHGIAPAIETLAAEAKRGPPEVKPFADKMIAMLKGGVEEVAHFFVCCFSRSGDDLGQWRAYGNDGHGYALGFRGQVLEQAFTHVDGKPVPGPMTFPITYDDDQLREMQKQIIEKAIPLISMPRGRGLSNPIINDFMSELSINLSVPLLRSALFFKHVAYSNEQEYRFLFLHKAGDVPNQKFRSRPYSLI